MQIKTTRRYHLTLVNMDKINIRTTGVGKGVEKGEPSHPVGREVPHECDNRVFRRCNFPPPGMPVPEEMVVAPR